MRRFAVTFWNGSHTEVSAQGWIQATYKALDVADAAGTTVHSITEISK